MKLNQPLYALIQDNEIVGTCESYIIGETKNDVRKEANVWCIPFTEEEIKKVIIKEIKG